MTISAEQMKRIALWLLFTFGDLAAVAALTWYWTWAHTDPDDPSVLEEKASALHSGISHALLVGVLSSLMTVAMIIFLTIVLDRLTARREFLQAMRDGTADATAMAIFTIGTAIYAGLIFHGMADALSAG